jgi:lipopolysaccharide/colanic/teichoic acid biosynthesis glycosyltransferase
LVRLTEESTHRYRREAVQPVRSSHYRKWGKRALDLALVVPGILILLPLLAVVAILTWAFLGLPVVYAQQRPGLGGAPFTLYKFRTMLDTADADGKPLPDDKRLTRFGSWLRSTSLDELPELFHVLSGKMSLVGPRPLLMQYLDRYSGDQARRHEVRPGITGWAQVRGRNVISWEDRFNLDVWYVDHCNLLLDLRILALTAWTVVRREGIAADGHVTMTEFKGSASEDD